MATLTHCDLYNIISVINCRLSSIECQAVADRRNVWEYEGWHEYQELRQLAGALMQGTLDVERFPVCEVEARLRRATGIALG